MNLSRTDCVPKTRVTPALCLYLAAQLVCLCKIASQLGYLVLNYLILLRVMAGWRDRVSTPVFPVWLPAPAGPLPFTPLNRVEALNLESRQEKVLRASAIFYYRFLRTLGAVRFR